jgi:DUF1680 family protein
VSDIVIPADSQLSARYDANLLGGVTVVETTGLARPSGDWSEKLYRPLERKLEKRLRLRFVPYFAWSNRGDPAPGQTGRRVPAEMSVWLPVK